MLLSVVVPAYNAESCISRMLKSLCAWRGNDIEIIVVDDGSEDSTVSLVRNFVELDKRVRLITQTNRGRSVARNVGLSAAEGKWIMFADADDYHLPNWEITVREALVQNGVSCDLCIFAVEKSDGLDSFCRPFDQSYLKDNAYIAPLRIRSAMFNNTVSTILPNAGDFEWNACWARLYKREILNKVISENNGFAFVPGLRFSEDRLLNLAYLGLIQDSKVGLIDSPVYYWDLGNSSTVAYSKVEDADNVRLYWEALNSSRLYYSSTLDERKLLALEMAGQFRKSASLPFRQLDKASKIWRSILHIPDIMNCISNMQVFLGPRFYLYGPTVMFLRLRMVITALIYQHFLQKLSFLLQSLRH